MMVVVVPTFPESENGQKEVVSTIVGSPESPGTPKMVEGVDEKCAVIKENCREQKAPCQTRPSIDVVAKNNGWDGWNPMQPVQ